MNEKDHCADAIAKKAAGEYAAGMVQDGMLIGLGTGSTTAFFIEALGRRCKEEGLCIKALASSKQSMLHAESLGIPMEDDQRVATLDLTVDGADEIDTEKNMIKGGGGALFREKLLAKSSHEMVVIVDQNKLVERLGSFPLPVEISPFIYRATLTRLEEHGYTGSLRLNRDSGIYITDNGNYIFDIVFRTPLTDPQATENNLLHIEGVIETGLFLHIAGRVIVGYRDGLVKIQS